MFGTIAKFFFDTFLGKAVAAGLGLVALVSAFAWDQRSRGANNAVAKIEKANDAAVNLGLAAAQKSAAADAAPAGPRRVRPTGKRDPLTRDD